MSDNEPSRVPKRMVPIIGCVGLPKTSVDCVISGLPWVILSSEDQKRLLEPAVRALRPGGTFSTFAYSRSEST